MSYIKHETRHLGDARWLDATPEAFVVHTWALDYCNEQRTDGHIPTKIAHRLNCPVEPAYVPDAFAVLVKLGWWEETPEGYFYPQFTAHGLAAEEQNATQARWADDKRRRRLHDLGNHQICTERSCAAARQQARESGTSSTTPQSGGAGSNTAGNGSTEMWTTRPDQTRPPRGGGGLEGKTREPRSAGAPRSTRAKPGDDKPPTHAFHAGPNGDSPLCHDCGQPERPITPHDYPDDGTDAYLTDPCTTCGLPFTHPAHLAHPFVGDHDRCDIDLDGCGEQRDHPAHTWTSTPDVHATEAP